MANVKRLRLIEGTFVFLFAIQAMRAFFSHSSSYLNQIIEKTTEPAIFVGSFALFIVMLIITGLVFSSKDLSPATHIIVLTVAIFRFTMSLGDPLLSFISSMGIVISSLAYFTILITINRYSWATTIVLSITVDLILRAYDTLDLSMKPWIDVPISGLQYRLPFFVIQLILSTALIILGYATKKRASLEEHFPGFVPVWGGLAFGALMTLQFMVLFLPNVIARLTSMPYESIIPWLTLAIVITLNTQVRVAFGALISHIEESLKGWILFFAIIILLIIGYRLTGIAAASSLVIAEFVCMMLVWWIAEPVIGDNRSPTGFSLSLGMIVAILSTVIYSLILTDAPELNILRGQTLALMIFECVLLCLPLVISSGTNPWLVPFSTIERGIGNALILSAVGITVFLSLPGPSQGSSSNDRLRIATYNINYGFDENGDFQFPLINLTIKASENQIIALQEVDTGHPASFGMDQIQYLSRHFGMNSAFYPDENKLRGLAILSTFTLRDSRGSFLRSEDETALMLAVNIQMSPESSEFQVLTGDLISSNQTDRLAQFAILFDLIDPDLRSIFAADLSTTTNDIVYRQLIQAGFVDPDSALGIEQNNTYPAINPIIRRDVILVDGFSILNTFQVDSSASDHRLVVVELVPE